MSKEYTADSRSERGKVGATAPVNRVCHELSSEIWIEPNVFRLRKRALSEFLLVGSLRRSYEGLSPLKRIQRACLINLCHFTQRREEIGLLSVPSLSLPSVIDVESWLTDVTHEITSRVIVGAFLTILSRRKHHRENVIDILQLIHHRSHFMMLTYSRNWITEEINLCLWHLLSLTWVNRSKPNFVLYIRFLIARRLIVKEEPPLMKDLRKLLC